ncbi:DNA/RNA polymerase [Mycena sanguinolenta]|uniref:DNA/RNA polymerase n=1 Tax=Mycena sanguinolenta TaxID=230812 RepID=A0A8H6ZDR7_9AGAR|nr:DNA/RNA polymerase [Mycena sanguinolenta]
MQDVDTARNARCEAAVESFKAGELTRIAVTLALHNILSEAIASVPGLSGTTPSSSDVEGFMGPYMEMCDQWTRDQEKAKAAGSGGAGSGGPAVQEEDGGAGGDEQDDDDVDNRPSKRRLVFEEDELPWVKNESHVSTAPLRADLAETVRLLGIYGGDPKRTLRSLLARTRVEFPESQWLRLLTNRPIDLDAVLTGIFSITASSAHTESLGDFDLTFNASGSSKPSRVVTSQADWTLAWMQTVQASLTVFPHLADQYREWGIYILAKFSAVHESQHLRVISFEKACRLLASRRADVALDQFYHFTALETMHLNSMGRLAVESSGDGSGKSKNSNGGKGGAKSKSRSPPAKSGEPCRLWNAGKCKRDSADCRNLHICAGCKKNHPESECPKHGKRRISPTALGTETDPPLPGVPLEVFDNKALINTVIQNPRLFNISTPINIDLFERLLASHPNQPLVASFCKGLREGFWPWSRPVSEHPVTLDNSKIARSTKEQEFLEKTRDEEIAAGRFSAAFPALLPWHARYPYPCCSSRTSVAALSRGTPLSPGLTGTVRAWMGFGSLLTISGSCAAPLGPHAEINIFKSDVKGAFKVLPMHILWQPWQVYRIAGKYHVDWAATFGSSASPPIWTTFAGFVLWIAMVVYIIPHLFAYMDDFHSAQAASEMQLYKPYNRMFPRNQTRLLLLWDSLGIPHSEDKQVFGTELVVIGFLVDTRRMRVTIPDDARLEFVAELRRWTHKSKYGVRRTLREWQALAGYANWVFNVFPLLKPALCNVYAKMEDKVKADAPIYVNEAVRRDLIWLADHVEKADGIYLIKSVDFHPDDANLVIYCDASTHGDDRGGMGFYYPALSFAFQAELPSDVDDSLKIFFFEALCVCAAVHHASSFLPRDARLTIYSDSSNTVSIFNSLKALPAYNDILISTIDVLIRCNIDLRVLHVPGKLNKVADAISRWNDRLAISLVPGLVVLPFTPPRDALGAALK